MTAPAFDLRRFARLAAQTAALCLLCTVSVWRILLARTRLRHVRFSDSICAVRIVVAWPLVCYPSYAPANACVWLIVLCCHAYHQNTPHFPRALFVVPWLLCACLISSIALDAGPNVWFQWTSRIACLGATAALVAWTAHVRYRMRRTRRPRATTVALWTAAGSAAAISGLPAKYSDVTLGISLALLLAYLTASDLQFLARACLARHRGERARGQPSQPPYSSSLSVNISYLSST